MTKKRYPGMDNLAPIKTSETYGSTYEPTEEPDWVGGAPNYDKFERMGFDTERTLVWLNID